MLTTVEWLSLIDTLKEPFMGHTSPHSPTALDGHSPWSSAPMSFGQQTRCHQDHCSHPIFTRQFPAMEERPARPCHGDRPGSRVDSNEALRTKVPVRLVLRLLLRCTIDLPHQPLTAPLLCNPLGLSSTTTLNSLRTSHLGMGRWTYHFTLYPRGPRTSANLCC